MRLFIAINFNNDFKDALSEATAQLRNASFHGRFTYADNLHLTLAFIGETSMPNEILYVMEDVCDRYFIEPIRLTISGAGIFRGKRGDLHWIGVEKTPELSSLALHLAAGLRDEGFDIEKRRFSPHITIGREVQLRPNAVIDVKHASMEADHISLMRSDRLDGKLKYTEVGSVSCLEGC